MPGKPAAMARRALRWKKTMTVDNDTVSNSADPQPGDQAVSPSPAAEVPAATTPAQDPVDPAPASAPPAPAEDNDGSIDDKGEETRLGKVMRVFGLKTKAVQAEEKAAAPAAAPVDDAPAAPAIPATQDGAPAEVTLPPEIAAHPAVRQMQADLARSSDFAGRFEIMNNYLQAHDVTAEEASNSLSLAAMYKSNPEKFYEEITRIREEVGVVLGKALPADLQREVDDGLLSEERAREMAKLRINEQVAVRTAESAQTAARTTSAQNQSFATGRTVEKWFAATAKTDPDLGLKIDDIEGEIYRLQTRHGAAADPQSQITLLNVAHKNVTERMRRIKPRPPAVTPPPRSNSAPAAVSNDPDKPKTRLDLVEGLFATKFSQ